MNKVHRLHTVVVAGLALTSVADRHQLSTADLRCLLCIDMLAPLGKVTAIVLTHALGLTYTSVNTQTRTLRKRGLLSVRKHNGAGLSLHLTADGLSLVALIGRQERTERARLLAFELRPVKRKYIRSGKFNGCWSQQQAKRLANAQQAPTAST